MNTNIINQLQKKAVNLRLLVEVLRKESDPDHDEIVEQYDALMLVINSKNK